MVGWGYTFDDDNDDEGVEEVNVLIRRAHSDYHRCSN